MSFTGYIILGFIFGAIFFGIAVYALYWAVKRGEFTNLDKGARVIFDEDEEPEGRQTDFFPGKSRNKRK